MYSALLAFSIICAHYNQTLPKTWNPKKVEKRKPPFTVQKPKSHYKNIQIPQKGTKREESQRNVDSQCWTCHWWSQKHRRRRDAAQRVRASRSPRLPPSVDNPNRWPWPSAPPCQPPALPWCRSWWPTFLPASQPPCDDETLELRKLETKLRKNAEKQDRLCGEWALGWERRSSLYFEAAFGWIWVSISVRGGGWWMRFGSW